MHTDNYILKGDDRAGTSKLRGKHDMSPQDLRRVHYLEHAYNGFCSDHVCCYQGNEAFLGYIPCIFRFYLYTYIAGKV